MIGIIRARLMRWKKQIISLTFWLFFPCVATSLFIYGTTVIQEDSKVPIGVALEENTNKANDLLESMKENPLLQVYQVSKSEAKQRVEAHELDSAFIIEDGYEQAIIDGKRNRLLTSYLSNLSYAYVPVSETVVSFVQQETGRIKAAHTVMQLSDRWSRDEIISKAIEIQKEENLLQTSMAFHSNKQSQEKTDFIFSPIGIWAICSLLSSLLLSDWIIKERKANILPRFVYIKYSFKQYLVINLVLYTTLLLVFDILTFTIFTYLFGETITIELLVFVILYRIFAQVTGFIVSIPFSNTGLYYLISFILTLILTITSGAIIPIQGITILEILNPIYSFINLELSIWLPIMTILFVFWFIKGGKVENA